MHHEAQWGKFARGILLRKHYKQFEEIIRRAKELWIPLGVDWKSSPPTFTWPRSSAQLILRHLEKDDHAEEYQGHSYTFVGADELTNWASPYAIDKMRATLRSANGVKCIFRGTGNPGGPGHSWVKGRYVDPAAPLKIHYCEIHLEGGVIAKRQRVYIPALLEDNKRLIEADPEYWQRVVESVAGNEALIKAWRWGLWDIVAGGAFDDVWRSNIHVIPPFEIPPSWFVNRAFDWGSSKPFSVQWWAESDGTQAPNGRSYPRGTLFHVAEWYGCQKDKPNQGLQLIDTDIAKQALQIESDLKATILRGNTIHPGPGDVPEAINGVDMRQNMSRLGLKFDDPIKHSGSRRTGFQELRKKLKASLKAPMEDPGLFIFDSCRGWIRTVPVLPRDDRDQDDVDSEAEDHPYDATRYRLLSLKHKVQSKKLKGF